MTLHEVESMYPALEEWRDALSRLSHNGRLQTFSTQHTQQRGLEVVQPRIQGFRVAPLFCCAGGQVTVFYDAEDNPEATSLTLRLEMEDGRILPDRVVPGLRGSVEVSVPPQNNVLTLTAVTLLPDGSGSRQQTTGPVIKVLGFNAFTPPWLIEGTALPMTIDGQPHWGVEVPLVADQWATSLRPGEMGMAPFSPEITVRKRGVEDIQMHFPGDVYRFNEDTSMAGTWVLFVTTPGHDGSAPRLGINVRVFCE